MSQTRDFYQAIELLARMGATEALRDLVAQANGILEEIQQEECDAVARRLLAEALPGWDFDAEVTE